MYRETKVRLTSNLTSDAWKQEESEAKYLKYWEKNKQTMNLEFCTLQNHPSEVKKKNKGFLRQTKIERTCF